MYMTLDEKKIRKELSNKSVDELEQALNKAKMDLLSGGNTAQLSLGMGSEQFDNFFEGTANASLQP